MRNHTLDAMIENILNKNQHIIEGMQGIADRYEAGDFYGISEDCTTVIRDIQDALSCNYMAAGNFFAAEMRTRHNINVD